MSSYVIVCVDTTTVRMMVLMMIMMLLYVYEGSLCCHGFTTLSSLPSTSTVTVNRRSSSTTTSSTIVTTTTTTTTARTTRPGTWMIIGVSSTKESGLKMSIGGDGDNKIVVEPRQFVQLTNPLDGMMLEDDNNMIGGGGGGTGRRSDNDNVALSSVGSKLPASFITSWSTWVLERDGTWNKIPDATSTVSSAISGELDDKNSGSEASIAEQLSTGHVNPSSIDELWSPIDLKRPQMRLALAAHVRQGVIRHIMPAVDVGYLSSSNSNSNSNDDGDNNSGTKSSSVVTYRNRGMCSVPRSHTWMEFLGRYGRFKLIASMKRNGQNINKYDDDEDRHEEEGKEEWRTILQSSPTGQDISDAIERVTVALADENVPTELGDGSHVVNIILTGDDTTADGIDIGEKFVEIPKAGHELRVSMVAVKDSSSSKNSNSDIGSSQKMIETTEDRKIKEQCREVARLQVQISSTMPGSESQYLPEVYKELYNDPSLRNPLYDKFKSRKQEKQQQQQQQ
eukprot:CAMPEP_0113467784 /NCGR_PEP_ID=MMETSP0014_2-20120614/15000_1 /TAXON_ID=2857 /ORGANISM="Nitzschia sp." /LENGTH=508 /DNA_ID=CAMNT_0000360117 /DNA_START=156 /DNA_END=1682 /DNA_ORIENTATION=+ /assembly_acc=CAM_ASM_000159